MILVNEQHTQLCMLLDDTPIASVLHKVSEEHWMELYHRYLYDFIRSVHHVPHHKSNDEYEVSLYTSTHYTVICLYIDP